MAANLILLKKNGSHRTFPLSSSVTIIGRRRDCDLRIPLACVSRRHCQLNHDGGVLKIRDLSSRNGTILNDKRIAEATIQAGDSIKVGPLTFTLQIDGKPETIVRPEVAWRNQPQEDMQVEDITDEQFSSFAEPDESDELLPDDSDLLSDDLDSLLDDG